MNELSEDELELELIPSCSRASSFIGSPMHLVSILYELSYVADMDAKIAKTRSKCRAWQLVGLLT